MSWFLSLLVLAGPVESDSQVTVDVPQALRLEHGWQTGPFCGPNVVYFLLRTLGQDVTHAEIIAGFGVLDEKGASLHQLKTVAEQHGGRVAVVKADARGLMRLRPPFVAHLDTPSGRGHYILVCGVDNREVRFLDGTQLLVKKTNLAAFLRSCSGYALVVGRSPFWAMGKMVFAGAVVIAVFILVARRLFGNVPTLAAKTT